MFIRDGLEREVGDLGVAREDGRHRLLLRADRFDPAGERPAIPPFEMREVSLKKFDVAGGRLEVPDPATPAGLARRRFEEIDGFGGECPREGTQPTLVDR